MARTKTFPTVGRLQPVSYKALPSVKAFLSRYAGYSGNVSEGTRHAVRRLCELSLYARQLMGQVADAGFTIPPDIVYVTGSPVESGGVEDVGVNSEEPTRYGVVMIPGSITLTPAEMEFLNRFGEGVGGGLRLMVQELVRLGDEKACAILSSLGEDDFVPPRWLDYAAAHQPAAAP